MKTLLKRFFVVEDRVVGPSYDPYSRHIVRMIEQFSDGAERRVILQICSLAGTSLEIQTWPSQSLSTPRQRSAGVGASIERTTAEVNENDSPLLLRKFEELVGVSLARIEEKYYHEREERFSWRIGP